VEAFTWGIEINARLQASTSPVPDRAFKAVAVLGSEELNLLLIPVLRSPGRQ
jgi:hypothetical protein